MLEEPRYSEYVGYLDADLSTPLFEVERLVDYFSTQQKCQMLMGSRIRYLGTHIIRNPFKHYTGRVFATAASIILKMGVCLALISEFLN